MPLMRKDIRGCAFCSWRSVMTELSWYCNRMIVCEASREHFALTYIRTKIVLGEDEQKYATRDYFVHLLVGREGKIY